MGPSRPAGLGSFPAQFTDERSSLPRDLTRLRTRDPRAKHGNCRSTVGADGGAEYEAETRRDLEQASDRSMLIERLASY
jgi:hypothetical protein